MTKPTTKKGTDNFDERQWIFLHAHRKTTIHCWCCLNGRYLCKWHKMNCAPNSIASCEKGTWINGSGIMWLTVKKIKIPKRNAVFSFLSYTCTEKSKSFWVLISSYHCLSPFKTSNKQMEIKKNSLKINIEQEHKLMTHSKSQIIKWLK